MKTLLLLGAVGFVTLMPKPAVGQSLIVPDDTLGAERSQVTTVGDIERIAGGARRSQNLFHSFEEFNVSEGRGAIFESPLGLENIFSRVTGSNPSEIFGTLGVEGAANLFFLNPNGIVFSENASLDIQGSFVGSTGTSFNFADGSEFNAVSPESSLLTVSVPLGLQHGPSAPKATISNRGAIAVGQDLTLSAGVLDLEGQIVAGENLTLRAADLLRIRDSAAEPFVAASGGEMLVQGDRAVDIFALNHPESGLFSGEDMVLRSANAVGGDAHYWSGGNFRVERLTEDVGDLFSPKDPVIRALGDVAFNNHLGSSLHILAGGSVDVGTIFVTGVDVGTLGLDFIRETVQLSDGTQVLVDGSLQPTVDIRAGVEPSQVGMPGITGINADFFFDDLFNFESPELSDVPSGSQISMGDIVINVPDGLVLITNQYRSNPSLPPGNILIGENGFGGRGIVVDGEGGSGSSVFIDSRGDIELAEGTSIDTSSDIAQGGEIKLLAAGTARLEARSSLSSSSDQGQAGDITLSADNISVGFFSSIISNGNGGDIDFSGDRLRLENLSQVSSFASGDGDGGEITLNISDRVTVDGGNLGSLVRPTATGEGGNITITTRDLEVIGFAIGGSSFPDGFLTGGDIASDTTGRGNAGDIRIDAESVRLVDGAQIRASTLALTPSGGTGNAGDIVIRASDSVEVTGIILESEDPSKISTTVNRGATGIGGSLSIDTNRLIVSNGAQIQAGAFGTGRGGNILVDATESIDIFDEIDDSNPTGLFTGPEGDFGTGRGGDITLRTGQLRLSGGDSAISNDVDARATGDAGNTLIEVDNLTIAAGARISNGTFGVGQGGDLAINASQGIELLGTDSNGSREEPSAIFTATFGLADGGNISLEANQLAVRDGAAITASTFGLSRETLQPGRGGSVTIDVADTIEVVGQSASGRLSSTIASEAGRIFNLSNANSTARGGDVSLTASSISVEDAAEISTQTFGSGDAGGLSINATDQVRLIDGSLRTRTRGAGNAGDLEIITGRLVVEGDAEATAATERGSGDGGNLFVAASDSIELSGVGGLGTLSNLGGDAGSIRVETGRLTVDAGAGITTSAIGSGEAGDLTIEASERVEVAGGRFALGADANDDLGFIVFDPDEQIFIRSRITTQSSSLPENPAGNLSIETGQLRILGGGEVSTSTLGDNPGGNLRISASQLVEVIGRSSTEIPSLISAQTLGLGDGGNIAIETNHLNLADGGQISASTSIGGRPEGTSLNTGQPGSIAVRGADIVSLSDNASISTAIGAGTVVASPDDDQLGEINIQTGQLALDSNSQITSSTAGQGSAGRILIDSSESTTLTNSSEITTSVQAGATGNSQQIILRAPQLRLSGNSQITAATSGNGNAGAIEILEATLVELSDSTISTAIDRGAIASQPSSIAIDTRSLQLDSGADITASTAGQGDAGSISVTAAERIALNGSSITTVINSTGRGRGGNIVLRTEQLGASNGAEISSSTFGQGNAGLVDIQASDVDLFSSTVSSEVGRRANGSGGDIIFRARNLTLGDRAAISSRSRRVPEADSEALPRPAGNLQGDAGSIFITLDDLLALEDSDITTQAASFAGGAIEIRASDVRLSGDGDIQTFVQSGTEGGGDIRITADTVIAFDDSDVFAFAQEGIGGSIILDTPAFFGENFSLASLSANPSPLDGNNRVDINATGGVSGAVTIPDVSFIQNSLADLPESVINTEGLITNSCVVRNQDGGSFVVIGSGGLPEQPGNTTTHYSTGDVQPVPTEEIWQPGDPMVEPQGLYQLPNGELLLSHACQR